MEDILHFKSKLYEDLPSESIKQHPTKTYLSSIKAIYVTDRFNEVFGVGQWTIKVDLIKHIEETGMVVVKVIFEVPRFNIYYESFGGNDNGGKSNKNFDLGDAFKGASTDAITKIGSYMGVGIKVFKGLSDTPSESTSTGKEKEWLNHGTKTWKSCLEKKADIKTIRDHFKLSKANEAKYLEELKSLK